MYNRFFEIETNPYLNVVYILAFLKDREGRISIKELVLGVYLIKNPNICMKLLAGREKSAFKKGIPTYQLYSIQSEMSRYTETIFTEDVYNALELLACRGLIYYEAEGIVKDTDKFKFINFKTFTKEVMHKVKYVNIILTSGSSEDIEDKIDSVWREHNE